MQEKMETQISAKYSQEESRLFAFKKLMEEANIHVNYPAGEEVIEDKHDFAITHEDELQESFDKTEVDFLKSVKETPIHVVFNIFKDQEGYIGESASIEISYALAHNKPVVLLRDPIFAHSVPEEIQEIITEKINKINITDLDSLSPEELEKYVSAKSTEIINYELTDQQKTICMRHIRGLLKSKKQNWKSKEEN